MWKSIVLCLAAFLVVDAQTPPAECMGSRPSVRPHQCCNGFPRFMTKEAAEECGLPAAWAEGPPGGMGGPPGGMGGPPGGMGGPGRGGPPCSATICLLKKNNLVSDDNKINRQTMKTFMSQQYPAEWAAAIDQSINACGTEADNTAGDECGPKKFVHCFKHNMFMNCPANIWVASTECNELKTHMQKCHPPFSG